jgi:hypothetical protein
MQETQGNRLGQFPALVGLFILRFQLDQPFFITKHIICRKRLLVFLYYDFSSINRSLLRHTLFAATLRQDVWIYINWSTETRCLQVRRKGCKRKHSGRKGDGHEKHHDPSSANLKEEEPIDIENAVDETNPSDGTANALSRRDWDFQKGRCDNGQGCGKFGTCSTRGRQFGHLPPEGLHDLVSIARIGVGVR